MFKMNCINLYITCKSTILFFYGKVWGRFLMLYIE